jgi:hypothetical protein
MIESPLKEYVRRPSMTAGSSSSRADDWVDKYQVYCQLNESAAKLKPGRQQHRIAYTRERCELCRTRASHAPSRLKSAELHGFINGLRRMDQRTEMRNRDALVQAFERLRSIVPLPTPIIMVMGNHEYYHRTLPDEFAIARHRAQEFAIHLLENDVVVIGGVRFAGGTLWTDYAIFGPGSQTHDMAVAQDGLNDHRRITWRKTPWQRFRPQEALGLHQSSRCYLAGLLATSFDGPTVVVTHHAVG